MSAAKTLSRGTIKDDTKKTGLISKTKAKDSNDNNIYCRLDIVFEGTEARGAMRGKCW